MAGDDDYDDEDDDGAESSDTFNIKNILFKEGDYEHVYLYIFAGGYYDKTHKLYKVKFGTTIETFFKDDHLYWTWEMDEGMYATDYIYSNKSFT